jgi:ABC-type phosphate/phosphonate transport system substrate-binding protein
MRVSLLIAVLMVPVLAGCVSHDHTLRVAFVAKDTATAPHEDLDQLAEFLEAQMGIPVEIFFFTRSTAALEAVAYGQADVASVDGAAGWLAWKELGMEAIATEVRSDGRTHYLASAWTTAGSDIQSVDDFEGRTSCHTGRLKSAGMFMPMGYLVEQGKISTDGYADDISQVAVMAQDFFDEPILGTGNYEGYAGALRCLSDGAGDIAFVRDTTPADECTPGTPRTANNEDWCLALDDYRKIVDFGEVPEHPLMMSGESSEAFRLRVQAAFLALNDSEEGQGLLDRTFGTSGLKPVTSAQHLGDYGRLISLLPGIEDYALPAESS